MLHSGPLVVEHRRAWHTHDPRGHAHVVGAVAERDVAAARAALARVLARPAHQRCRARGQSPRLRGQALAAAATHTLMLDPVPVALSYRLRDVQRPDAVLRSV